MSIAGFPVVVGVDDSARSLAAVEVAADAAVTRHRALRIVHALIFVPSRVAADPAMAPPAYAEYRNQAETLLAEAVRVARRQAPQVDITAAVLPGGASAVLVGESRHADLVVLGDRGVGAATELVTGSVAMGVASHSRCPVLIVRGTQSPDGAVVVGVDGSAGSRHALLFAAEEAALRGAELVALHAWDAGDGTELNAELPMPHETWSGDEEQQRVLAEALAGIAEKYPDLSIRRQVRRGSARRLLTDWSGTAQLVVVGNRGHGNLAGLLLGSVGRHLVHHAASPVAIVRAVPAG